jgi:Protein of unknown function (DUF2283)
MAVTEIPSWDLDYDDEVDVLYASRGAPQPAASLEVIDDVLLRYVPPQTDVVGITIINFLKHFPNVKAKPFQAHATAVLADLFRKYPAVPMP